MEPSPLVYDTAAAAAVWQRVGPALPAYDAAPCPAGACCPLPRRETDSEAMLGGLIAEGAALYACCRRCAVRAPRQSRQALEQLAREEQRAVRALLAAYFLHTGRWRQPPAPAGGGYGRRGWRPCGGCMWARRWCSGAAPIWRRAWRTAVCGSCWRRRRIARRNGENGWQTCWKKP